MSSSLSWTRIGGKGEQESFLERGTHEYELKGQKERQVTCKAY